MVTVEDFRIWRDFISDYLVVLSFTQAIQISDLTCNAIKICHQVH